MIQVIKRDGTRADFTLSKINDAITKAFTATQMEYNNDIVDLLALRVTADFQRKVKDSAVYVEDIQDSVERVLGQAGYEEVAKAYILYRKQREKMRTMKSTILDYKDVVNSYVKVEDWRVKENSTVTYSVGGLILSNSGAVTANYWLSEIYDEEIAEAHRNADIHIHDLSMLTGYCAGWSLKQLIKEGLGGITGKITSAPAKHLSVLCNQMVNFLGIMQNEWAGAQAFSSFDTYLAPFVKVDNLSYGEVKKCIEAFIYGVNTPSRWGTQAPFSNITLDWTVPNDLAELPAIVGGEEMDFKYKDCKREMDMVNKAFIETMIEGDSNGRGFQYPIPTYSITRDFDWSDTENNRLLFEMTAKYGTPYFSNYINSDMEPSDVRSMCCRLRLDLRELRKKTGGFFGSGESTGSVGVVTVNMPRIAYQSANKSDFYKRLDHMMDIAARSLKIKRGVITRLLDEGLYPYTKKYLGTFDNHFSTIGLIGMNEVGLNANWLRADMSD
ncbi:MAG: ribonucleoside triphosphate reductase, partial [Acetatifactor sp.]|nr:ribonucleoside triphosphate reductase [Acetatifactor sp.]